MVSKNIMIEKSVFEALKKFRDYEGLASYTEAINDLLAIYDLITATQFEYRELIKVTGPFIGELGHSNQETSSLNIPSITVKT